MLINCLRLFVVVSDGRHVCTKYHGHTYYYQQLLGCNVENGAYFVVGCEHYCHGDGSGGAHLYTQH